MALNSILVLTAILASFLVFQAYANPTTASSASKDLYCYTCPDCRDPSNDTKVYLDSKLLIKCKAGTESCFKYHHSDKKVQRGCSEKSYEKGCPEDEGGKFNFQWCYTCYHSECNSGRRSVDVYSATIAAGLIIGFAAFSLRKNY